MFGRNEGINGISHPLDVLDFRRGGTFYGLEGLPMVGGEKISELLSLPFHRGQFRFRGRVLGVAGVVSQEYLNLIGHAISVAVVACDEAEPRGQVSFEAFPGEFLAEQAELMAKGVVRKFLEVLRRLDVAGQMTGSTT